MSSYKSKVWILFIIGIFSITILAGCSKRAEEVSNLSLQIVELNNEIQLKDSEIATLSSENRMLKQKVDEAKPWFEMGEQEQKKMEEVLVKAKEAEETAKKKKEADEAKAREAEEAARKKKEEAENAAKLAEEKKGYETGITYDQLARNPDDYYFKKVKFKGKVIQVMEGNDNTQLRIAVNSNYDRIIYVEYDSKIIRSRVLDDDIITIYGVSMGLLTYKSTLGGNITIPSILVAKIDQ